MKAAAWHKLLSIFAITVLAGTCYGWSGIASTPGHKSDAYWQIDDLKAGMKGFGKTVMRGTKVENFDVEVLGVLKNTSPGRDMVLCRCSGLNLEKTGIIAGMSGSPVYINDKLLGAVAYAWPFGKEPIAGVTPFSQMHNYVLAFDDSDETNRKKPTRVGLNTPVTVDGLTFDSVMVAGSNPPAAKAADGLWMVPLQLPVAATGFTPRSLELLQQRFPGGGLVPVQAGGATARVAEEEKDAVLEPGGPLAVAMVTGDFDLSGLGTVTHIEGKRVYGWGHPFFGLGECEFPMMTGYVHTIYPRQSVSFKMGSPLKTVGIINADVSTGIAGWLDRKPDMMPVRMTVTREPNGTSKTFNVEVARQRSMLPTLVFTVLTNSVDMEGQLPEELTADMKATIELEDGAPIVIHDTFSGSSYSGGRAPQALYNQIAAVVNLLTYNTYKPVRIKRIECETRIRPGRQTADVEAIELESDTYAPGDTLKVTLFVRPYKGMQQRLPVTLKLPVDMPEGSYSATVCDDLTNARHELHDNPILNNPQNLPQLLDALKVQTSAKRTNIVVRVPVSAAGVVLGDKSLPSLPPSMVQILGQSRKTGAQTIGSALVSKTPTEWVFSGTESVKFTVTKNKKTSGE